MSKVGQRSPDSSSTYSLVFPIHDGTKLKLSSGAHFTMHADFFNGWVQTKLDSLVATCLRARINCGTLKS